jgi:hypothetical protein
LGARDIDLDSEAGWVRFRLYQDRPLDLAGLPHLMERASYVLRGIELWTTGTLVKDHGGNGGGELSFKVAATGEVLPVQLGKLPPRDGQIRVKATVTGWDTGEPRLTVTEINAATGSS